MDSQAFVSGTGAGVGSKKVTSDLNAVLRRHHRQLSAGAAAVRGAAGDYSTGNKARDNLAKGIRYFQPLTTDGIYYAGWAQIMALGVDYFNGVSMAGMGSNIGYDRYGRAQLGFRTTYAVVPPLSFYAVVSPTWTAEKVDTDTNAGLVPGAVGLTTWPTDREPEQLGVGRFQLHRNRGGPRDDLALFRERCLRSCRRLPVRGRRARHHGVHQRRGDLQRQAF